MTRSQLLIRLPEDLKAALVARAQSEGKPLNQWVQDALIAALDSSLIAGDSSPDSTAAITPDSPDRDAGKVAAPGTDDGESQGLARDEIEQILKDVKNKRFGMREGLERIAQAIDSPQKNS